MEHRHAASRLLGQQTHGLLSGRRLSERPWRARGLGPFTCHDQHLVAFGDEYAGGRYGGDAARVLAGFVMPVYEGQCRVENPALSILQAWPTGMIAERATISVMLPANHPSPLRPESAG